MDSIERHQHQPEAAPSYDLSNVSAEEALDQYRDMAYKWMEDKDESDGEEVASRQPLARFGEAAREAIAHNEELALDYLDAVEEREGSDRSFADQLLGAVAAAELTRYDPVRGKRMWMRALFSRHPEINIAAGRSLAQAVESQSLPPQVLASVVLTLAQVGAWAAHEPAARTRFDALTTPSSRL